MKRRLTACLLAMAMLTAMLPTALAENTTGSTTQTDTQAATKTSYAAAPDISDITSGQTVDGYTFVDLDEYEITADAQVIEPEPMEEAAPAEDELETIAPQVNARSTEMTEIAESVNARSATATAKTDSFTTYGAQLGSIGLVASESHVIYDLGSVLTTLYANAKAELAKGENSLYFLGDRARIKNSGLWFDLPNTSKAERYQILTAIMWIVYRSLDYDSPEMFYSNAICSAECSYENQTVYLAIIPGYGAGMDTLEARQNLKNQLDAKVAELVEQAKAYPRAYDKIKFFHDWICDNNVYNNAAASSGSYIRSVSALPWSSVGALLGSTSDSVSAPVCEGYTRALQLLCSQVGINAPLITSALHMWNNVHYGSSWTAIDTTWDDASYGITHNYFMKILNDSDGIHALNDSQFLYFAYPNLTEIDSSDVLPFYDSMTWEREYVQWVYDTGYMNGYNCVQFGVSDMLTRAQFAQILYNIAGKPAVTYSAKYSDVAESDWYASACLWAAENNISNGYADSYFGAKDYITREQIVTMLFRRGNASAVDYDLSVYSDGGLVSGWASDAVRWSISRGIISGYGNGILGPTNNATRGQTAKIITVIEEMNNTEDGEVPADGTQQPAA